MSLDLEKQLRFYGAYHHNTVNIAIHVVCVPTILMAFILLFTNSPSIPLPTWMSVPLLPLNCGTALAAVYSTLYILMEPVAGAMLAPIILGGTAYAHHLNTTYGATANYWATGLNIACWVAQFIGHGVFEGRAPALFDNLVQALFLAPFFVWFELLFALGYRPDLKRRVNKGVERELQLFKETESNRVNGTAEGSNKKL